MRTILKSRQILEWLDSQEDSMISLLEQIVNIDSGSYDKAGVDEVGKVLQAFLDENAIPFKTMPIDKHGDIIRATVDSPGTHNRNVLLMGHRDTVFPKGHAGRRPFMVRDGRAYGPGVADMKAGLVMNSFVAAAFARFGGAPAPLVVLYTGDEEIGSPSSAPIITEEARNAWAVFNAEPGRANGNVVTARRGCIFVRLTTKGKAAHSGVNFRDGCSAIEEMASKIVAIRKLTDSDRQITTNVGLVSGGQSVNTVAPEAEACIDLRYFVPNHRKVLMDALSEITATSMVPGAHGQMEVYGEFPPLYDTPASKNLFLHYQAAAGEIDLALDGEQTNGAADSGFAAAAGAPTICGVGPVGGRYHSDEEYLEVGSMVARAKALVLSIMTLPEVL